MLNSTFFLIATDEPGGLFDFGATLPLVAIEFLLLMFVLNLILYTPLFAVINKRNEYIITNLSKANELLQEVDTLTLQYEKELMETKAKVQKDLILFQKKQKNSFDQELLRSQTLIDKLLQQFLENFNEKRLILLDGLNLNVEVLSKAIYSSIFQ